MNKLESSYFIIFRYATAITLFLQLLYYEEIIKLSSSMLLLSCITFIGGLYMTYHKPKKFSIPELKLHLEGYQLRLGDIIIHHAPFFYFLYRTIFKQTKYRKDNLLFALVGSIIYLSIFNLEQLYGFNNYDVMSIISISILLFYLIEMSIKKSLI